MTDTDKRPRRLAKGLSALLGDMNDHVVAGDAPARVPIEFLRPNPRQPRRVFVDDDLQSLASSIRERGFLQPIVVRPDAEIAGNYEIIAGERRWRAAQIAQLHDVPVLVRALSDQEALEIALVENMQRQDLMPLEEATGYQRLIDEYHHTQEDLAKVVGRSRSHVANVLRLLTLPEEVKVMLEAGNLTAGHARAALGAADPAEVAREIAARGLNVRQAERLARRKAASKNPRRPASLATRDVDTRDLERRLSDRLGLAVRIHHRGPGGELRIHYRTVEDLDDVLRGLGDRRRTS
jgi:ParB family chromosome partitioning protein